MDDGSRLHVRMAGGGTIGVECICERWGIERPDSGIDRRSDVRRGSSETDSGWVASEGEWVLEFSTFKHVELHGKQVR